MKKGFTLVELIVTLSLILLISSFSFMSLNSFLETKNKIKTKEFLYEIEDYFWIEKELKNKILLYKYNKKIYMVINHNIDDILLGKIIENSNLKYKDNQKIIKEKNLITI